jgi:hypothetical protein
MASVHRCSMVCKVLLPLRVLLTSALSVSWRTRLALASSARLRSVMSRAIVEAPTMFPAESFMGDMVSETSRSLRSLVIRTVS